VVSCRMGHADFMAAFVLVPVSRHRPYDFFAPLHQWRDAKRFLSVGWRVDIGSTAIPAGSSCELNDRAADN
jgi:hypothetical protein